MSEQMHREGWANVYASGKTGECFNNREDAVWFRRCGGSPITHRWHVRLKPEGAPKRYESDLERQMYEHMARYPEAMRFLALCKVSPRTPKIEESA